MSNKFNLLTPSSANGPDVEDDVPLELRENENIKITNTKAEEQRHRSNSDTNYQRMIEKKQKHDTSSPDSLSPFDLHVSKTTKTPSPSSSPSSTPLSSSFTVPLILTTEAAAVAAAAAAETTTTTTKTKTTTEEEVEEEETIGARTSTAGTMMLSSPQSPIKASKSMPVLKSKGNSNTNESRWSINSANLESSLFADSQIVYLRSRLNGLYLKQAGNGKYMTISKFKGDVSQQFVLQDNTIISAADKKAVEIYDPKSYFISPYVHMAELDKLNSLQTFHYDINGRIVSESNSFMGQCLEIKGGSSRKNSSVVISKAKTDQDAIHQFWDIIPKSKKQVRDLSQFTSKKKMGGYMGSQFLEFNGEKIFFKPHKSELSLLLETGCSILANYITGGFVPEAKRCVFQGIAGAFQPFVTMNTDPFKKLTYDKNYVVEFNFMNQKQLHQLFVQMIADRLVSNWDTHNEQFALDADDNVLGYDKEKAFYLFEMKNIDLLYKINLKEDYRRLDFHFNLWKNPTTMARNHNLFFIYSSLVYHIKKGNITIDPKDIIIENMFKRCENISLDQVKENLDDYALRYYTYPQCSEFINIVYKRIKNIRKPVYHYFGWKGVPEDAPHDPWVLDSWVLDP